MSFNLSATLDTLERTPEVLDALLGTLPDALSRADEGPDTFSPRDVLGHLIHGEQTDWVPRIRILREHGESVPFEPFDRFGFRELLEDKSNSELLEQFRTLRQEGLSYLKSLDLDQDALARKGRHPQLGSVTLQQLLTTWAVHDLGHIRQIVRVLAFQSRDDVGPWKQYLTILQQ